MKIGERVTLEIRLTPGDVEEALRRDVMAGLSGDRKELPPKWFYDERGCALFDAITRLPEYYLTRAERDILVARASNIAGASRAATVIELGSGSSEKTRMLLDALRDAGTLERYVPLDVSESALREAGSAIAAQYGIAVHAITADFERHLDDLPAGGRRLVAFLGSTIGNLYPSERAHLLRTVASQLRQGDSFLLGTDLVKDPEVLHAAYNDSAGVTAAFNRNMLAVLNRRLDADFDIRAFQHVAGWDPENEWIAIGLRSTGAQHVHVRALGLKVEFAPGEELRTEISAKFRRDRVVAELASAGLDVVCWWTDPQERFALSLAVPAG